MKFGFRTPSLKKRISARTSLKRVVRHKAGLKAPRGMGIVTNPKKAVYNKIYRKTAFGIEDIGKLAKKGQSKKTGSSPTTQEFSTGNSVLDKHFELSENIPDYYKKRDEAGMLDKTIAICRQQIELAPQAKSAFLERYPQQPLPNHRGYKQLVIVLDKQGNQEGAIKLCQQAKNESWAGDWDKRIARYSSKLNK